MLNKQRTRQTKRTEIYYDVIVSYNDGTTEKFDKVINIHHGENIYSLTIEFNNIDSKNARIKVVVLSLYAVKKIFYTAERKTYDM